MLKFKGTSYKLSRYPKSKNNSLQAWSAVDELLLHQLEEIETKDKKITTVHDTFGALTIPLMSSQNTCVVNLKSQLKAIRNNIDLNSANTKDFNFSTPDKLNSINSDIVLLKIPKSLELFYLYLARLFNTLTEKSIVYCGFMTRHFTPAWTEISSSFFSDVSQTKAQKKARVLVLKGPKKSVDIKELYHKIDNTLNLNLKQYNGVFSSSRVDFATQLLLNNLPNIPSGIKVLDLACGNGVIGAFIKNAHPSIDLHLIDDNYLAIASAKLNIKKDDATFHWNNTIDGLKSSEFDLVLCNPPFHFEYENTAEIAHSLFKESYNHLKLGGEMRIVSNSHLKYLSFLRKLFGSVSIIDANDKYQVISCIK